MKKVLVLFPRAPYPGLSGYDNKNVKLLEVLSKHYQVTAVILTYSAIPSKVVQALRKYCSEIKLFRISPVNTIVRLTLSIFNHIPFQVALTESPKLRDYLEENSKRFNMAIFVLPRTAQYGKFFFGPRILDMHDSLAIRYNEAARITRSPLLKLIYYLEGKRLTNYERKCVKDFDRVFLFNKYEVEQLAPFGNVKHLPHGVSEQLLEYSQTDSTYSNVVSFIGKMNYQPNVDAAIWFVENVMDKLHPELEFYIIGGYPTAKVQRLQKRNKRVKVLGYVQDPYVILRSSCCVVAPIRIGAGIQNKVLESMAVGALTIVTSKAAKPIGALDGRHYLIADKAEEMAFLINDIYANPKKYEHIRQSAREYIKNNFTWSMFENVYISELQKILQDNS